MYKFVLISACFIFVIMAFFGLYKKPAKKVVIAPKSVTEVVLKKNRTCQPAPKDRCEAKESKPAWQPSVKDVAECENVDLIEGFFTTDKFKKLPIVETVTYTSRVPWLRGRPAWVADYASHYNTTRHFIARSLNRKPDYFTQNVSHGDKFNVLKKDLNFHLVISLNDAKMRFYALDTKDNRRYFIKSYRVGLGRRDPGSPSGLLTPKGKYLLGERVAVYKPGIKGYFQDRQIEMINVFGTRWIPFEKELEGATSSAKGFGLHGSPWIRDPKTLELTEDRRHVGFYDSDGCIRLYSEDIEELFSIIISKPTIVEIVDDFSKVEISETQTTR